MYCDACDYAVGSALFQEREKVMKPVGYFSKHLTITQKSYPTSEKELLAIVLSCEYWVQYLWGNNFTVYTDHQPLTYMMSIEKPASRLARWLIRLRDFDFKIIYKPGKQNGCADGMSRWMLEDGFSKETRDDLHDLLIALVELETLAEHPYSPPYYTQAKLEQSQDSDITWIIELIERCGLNKPVLVEFDNKIRQRLFFEYKRLVVSDGALFHVSENGDGRILRRLVLPFHLIQILLEKTHNFVLGGHMGIHKTKEKILSRFYRPKLRHLIEEYVRSCDICQKVKSKPRKIEALNPILPTRPKELVTMDIAGPLTLTSRLNRYFIVIVDHFTKFADAYALQDTKATTIADTLVTHMLTYGIPEKLLSDLGKNLQSQVLELVYEALGIERVKTSPYHPECDGLSERFIGTIKRMLACYVNEKSDDWDVHLKKLVFAYNVSVHSATNQTPFTMQFGQTPRIPIDLAFPHTQNFQSQRPDRQNDFTVIDEEYGDVTYLRDEFDTYSDKLPQEASDYVFELKQHLSDVFGRATSSRDFIMSKAKIYYDRKAKPQTYSINDRILVSHPQIKTGFSKGLAKKWHGPFVVLKKIGECDYLIQKLGAKRSRKYVIHSNNISKYFGRVDGQNNPDETLDLTVTAKVTKNKHKNNQKHKDHQVSEDATQTSMEDVAASTDDIQQHDVSSRDEPCTEPCDETPPVSRPEPTSEPPPPDDTNSSQGDDAVRLLSRFHQQQLLNIPTGPPKRSGRLQGKSKINYKE